MLKPSRRPRLFFPTLPQWLAWLLSPWLLFCCSANNRDQAADQAAAPEPKTEDPENMLQTYTFDDQGRQIDAVGDFLIFDSSGNQSAEIEVLLDGVNAGRFKVGDSVELPATVKRWQIVNVSGGVGAVRIGSGRLKRSGSVSVQGSVSVANIATPVQVRDRALNVSYANTQAALSFFMAATLAGKAKQVHIVNNSATLGAIKYLSVRPSAETFISVSAVKAFNSGALLLSNQMATGGGSENDRVFRPGAVGNFQLYSVWESHLQFPIPPAGLSGYLFGQLVKANEVFEFPLDRFPVLGTQNTGIVVGIHSTDVGAQFNVITDYQPLL